MLALDAENLDCDPEVMAVYEILSVREEIPASDDVLFFVDGCEALAASLMDKFAALQEQGVEDFSLENLRRVLDADAQRLTDAAGEVHDLSALFAPSGVGAASGVGVAVFFSASPSRATPFASACPARREVAAFS